MDTQAAQATAQPVYDKKDQLEKIQASLLPGEVVEAVFDLKSAGTGFIGITNKRVIIYDKAFLRKMKALVSIPYNRIYAIAAEDEEAWWGHRGFWSTSKLVLTTGKTEYEFEFRGADRAHIAHDLILRHMV